jgi:hypothetical protein
MPIICLSVGLLLALHVALSAYTRCTLAANRLEALTVRQRLFKQQAAELERSYRIWQKVSDFMETIRLAGLVEQNWAVYDVAIEEPLSYAELGQLLSQCAFAENQYFKPISLQIKSVDALAADETGPAKKPATADAPKADILLSLKGAFLVRQK